MQRFPGKYHSLKIFSYGCTHFHTLLYSCLLDVCVHFPPLYVVECWLLHFTAVDLDADSTLCHMLPVPINYQAFYSAADRCSISKIQDDSPKIQYEFRAKLQSHSPNVGRKDGCIVQSPWEGLAEQSQTPCLHLLSSKEGRVTFLRCVLGLNFLLRTFSIKYACFPSTPTRKHLFTHSYCDIS